MSYIVFFSRITDTRLFFECQMDEKEKKRKEKAITKKETKNQN